MPRKTPDSRAESSIEVLLREERVFRPAAAFRRSAIVRDKSLYSKAARDPEAFWAACARDILWLKPWKKVLAWNPPRNDPQDAWHRADPVLNMVRAALSEGVIDQAGITKLDAEVRETVTKAQATARAAPFPEATTAFTDGLAGGDLWPR